MLIKSAAGKKHCKANRNCHFGVLQHSHLLFGCSQLLIIFRSQNILSEVLLQCLGDTITTSIS